MNIGLGIGVVYDTDGLSISPNSVIQLTTEDSFDLITEDSSDLIL